jgi:hypothetical protein
MKTHEPSPQKQPATSGDRASANLASKFANPAIPLHETAPQQFTPNNLLYLQRAIGNAAVQRLLAQRSGAPKVRRAPDSEEPIGPEGGALSGDMERRLRASQSGGSHLPSTVRRAIEPKLGADLGSVKVHTDRTAAQLNRDLGAKAFTHGNHIYYGAGHTPNDVKLTAHEAVHTVQQGGVKAKRIQTKLKVGPANDRYEQEADNIAEQVMRKGNVPADGDEAQKTPQVQRIQRQPLGVIQRFSLNPAKWTKKGREKAEAKDKAKREQQEKQKADTGELLSLSSVFERNLGKYLFNHPRAQAASTTMATKMVAALIPEMDEKNKEHQAEIAKTFGKDAKKYAGNVGTEFSDVWAALKQGNVREKMTAVYNAMFGSFKELMQRLMSESAWDEAKTRGMDPRKLKIRKRQLKLNPMAKDPYRKPRAFLDRKKVKTFEFSMDMLKSETRNLKAGSKVTDRKAGELDEGPFKTGLSERERKFMFPDKQPDEDISNETLTWEEGGSTWDMKKNHKWVKNLTETLKMPVMAGPSGTAQRFFQVYEWLGKPLDAKDLRLALLGWMLVENDHSFHEIAQMGVEYGLPYSPGPAAYRKLEPLTEAEIRKNVNRDSKYPGLFPDEIQYHKKLDAGEYALMKPYMDDLEERTEHAPLIEEQFGMKKGAYDKSGLKHALRPVTAYTTIAYQTINMVAGGSPRITKIRLNSMLNTARTKHKDIVDAYRILYVEKKSKADLGDDLYNKYKKLVDTDFDKLSFAQKNIILVLASSPDVTVEGMMAEAKVHREHVNSGLELLPTFQGKVYRGEAQTIGGQSYKKGTKVNVKKFLSASRNSMSAVSYAKSSAGITDTGKKWYSSLRKPFILEMEAKTARDVNAVTVNEDTEVRDKKEAAGLDEVVFLPGTVLEVQDNPQPDPAFDNIPKVELKETKGGGVSDPKQRIEFNQTDAADVSGPVLEDDEDSESESDPGGLPYKALDEIRVGKMPGNFDVPIAEDEEFRIMDLKWESNYKDASTEWTEIRFGGRVYFALVYDLLMNASQVHAKKVPDKVEKPQPAPLQLHMTPYEDADGFALTYSKRADIVSHKPYDLQPGWSAVHISDSDGDVTMYAKTEDVVKFLSHGEVSEKDVDESGDKGEKNGKKDKDEEVVPGLDPADYPAGQHDVNIAAPIKLPAATTADGAYNTDVELFIGDKIPVHVEDDLTKKGRCRIVFFSQTYFVPLNMLITPTERKPVLDVVDVDEEEFVPETEGVKLQAIEGVMDLDPDNEPEIIKRAHPISIELKDRSKIMEYEERGSWIALMMDGAFYYAKISDWQAYKDA